MSSSFLYSIYFLNFPCSKSHLSLYIHVPPTFAGILHTSYSIFLSSDNISLNVQTVYIFYILIVFFSFLSSMFHYIYYFFTYFYFYYWLAKHSSFLFFSGITTYITYSVHCFHFYSCIVHQFSVFDCPMEI